MLRWFFFFFDVKMLTRAEKGKTVYFQSNARLGKCKISKHLQKRENTMHDERDATQ